MNFYNDIWHIFYATNHEKYTDGSNKTSFYGDKRKTMFDFDNVACERKFIINRQKYEE